MSILVATDFSPASRVALQLAGALARRRGWPLVLLHAFEPPPLDAAGIPMTTGTWQQDAITAAEAALADEATMLRRSGIAVETMVSVGSPAPLILDTAHNLRAALVVVGTHGKTGVARAFLGSVAETVVRSSTCPVLVAPAAAALSQRWKGSEPLRVTVASDGSATGEAAFAWAGSFAEATPCDLSLVRLYWPPDESVRYGLEDPWGGPVDGVELSVLLEQAVRKDAEQLIGPRAVDVRIRATDRDGSEALGQEAALASADLIILGVPRRRTFRRNLLAPGHVLRRSSVPVLCVPELGAPSRQAITRVRSVLVAVDLSPASPAVASMAYGLLKAGGGHVTLCTIHEVGPVDRVADMPAAPPLSGTQRAVLEARLRSLIPADAESCGISTDVAVIEGFSAPDAIRAAAERAGADLIAVGSHGRSGIKLALLGSVADEVARKTPVPVLIVRPGESGGDARVPSLH